MCKLCFFCTITINNSILQLKCTVSRTLHRNFYRDQIPISVIWHTTGLKPISQFRDFYNCLRHFSVQPSDTFQQLQLCSTTETGLVLALQGRAMPLPSAVGCWMKIRGGQFTGRPVHWLLCQCFYTVRWVTGTPVRRCARPYAKSSLLEQVQREKHENPLT